MKNNLIITIILLIGVGAAAFFGGMKYQQNKQPVFRQFGLQGGQRMMSQGQFQGSQNRQNFRPINGEIINTDEKSITVKMMDGSSRLVLITEKTNINKASEAKKEDLKIGERVAVFGPENNEGIITAQNIQINPFGHNLGVPNFQP